MVDYGAFMINCRPVDEDKCVEPSRLLEYVSNIIFKCHFVCVHSYRHPVKNLLLQKLQYYKRGLGSTLLNMSWNAQVVIAVIL